eukprot:TRINITY_DN16994_c0_g2_i1.p1 TRINITY_DN16994_c0_g2~~TRINITY_DN16994_c0_g2_i1.p1  ORF type:complete len:480 (-),score=114.25 TRINITY_DN16994_c0_g2_i1:252-1691(-)
MEATLLAGDASAEQLAMESHVLSPWVSIFHTLGGRSSFPTTLFEDEDWMQLLMGALVAPATLLVIGLIVSLATAGYLLCGSGHQPAGKRPSPHSLKCCAAIGFLVLWAVGGFCIIRTWLGFDILMHEVEDRLQPDVDLVATKLGTLAPMLYNAGKYISGWEESCVGWQYEKGVLPDSALAKNKFFEEAIVNASYTVKSLNERVQPLPALIANADRQAKDFGFWRKVGVFAVVFSPTLLVSLLVACIVAEAVEEGGESAAAAGWADFCILKMGAAPIAALILALTAVSTVLLCMGIVLGTYCSDPDDHTVKLVWAYEHRPGMNASHNLTETVAYYVKGVGPDPLDPLLDQVNSVVQPISDEMWAIAPALAALGVACEDADHAHVAKVIDTAIADVRVVEPLVKRSHLYPFYRDVLVNCVCGELVGEVRIRTITWQHRVADDGADTGWDGHLAEHRLLGARVSHRGCGRKAAERRGKAKGG